MQQDQQLRRYTLFVLLGLLLLAALAFLLPKDRELAFANMREDYIKGRWYYDRLFEDERPVDVAFIGTSHTNGNIRDDLVEALLREDYGLDVHVANLGLPEHGRNLHYVVARDLFANKSPRLLVLEVKSYESRRSHHLFGRLARVDDIVLPALFVNPSIFRDVLSGLRWQIEQYVLPEERLGDVELEPHGFHNNDRGVRLTAEEMAPLARKRHRIAVESHLGERFDGIEFAYPRHYVHRIIEMAQQSGTEIAFLYLPFFGAAETPRDYQRYLETGEVWLPPRRIFDDPGFWKDPGHLNTWGATELAPWLAQQVGRALDGNAPETPADRDL